MAENEKTKIDMATDLTIAWLSNPNVRANGDDVTQFLQSIHATLDRLSGDATDLPNAGSPATSTARDQEHVPAVTVRKSLASPERIISMIDGKPYTTLKRHLSRHGLTPAQYRERYGLKDDYPMTAPAYAERRRQIAQKIGLGQKGGRRKASAPAAAKAAKAPAKRGRPKAGS
jgi:predicted transcriptional regulator